MLGQRGSTTPTGYQFDHTVASVAPPSAITFARGKALRTRSGSVTGIQSPDSITSRSRLAPSAAAAAGNSGASRTSAAGAESQRVIPPPRNKATRRSGSASSSLVATCTVPPTASRPKMS